MYSSVAVIFFHLSSFCLVVLSTQLLSQVARSSSQSMLLERKLFQLARSGQEKKGVEAGLVSVRVAVRWSGRKRGGRELKTK